MVTTTSSKTCTYEAHRDDPSNWHGEKPEHWVLGVDSWSCPHDRLDHEAVAEPEYCVFHMDPEDLPDDVDEAAEFMRVVNEESNSDDPVEAQRKKEFVGATFGTFEIKETTTLNTADDFPIRFDHASFQDGISIVEVVFQHDVSFQAVEFSGGGDVSFSNAEFSGDGYVSFGYATFSGGDVFFFDATFSSDSYVSFQEATFSGGGDVDFSDAESSHYSHYRLHSLPGCIWRTCRSCASQ